MRHVVVIGGGYGGLRAIEHLAKDPTLKITLIDRNPYHFMQTESYGYIAGRFDIADVALDLKHWCAGLGPRVTFVREKVERIDLEAHEIVCASRRIGYDSLVIAAGAQTNFFPFIEGLGAHAYGVKSLERSFALRQAFERRIYQKLTGERIERRGDLHIVVGGAGLSGVEIAAEMAHTLRLYEKVLGTHAREITISLIDAAETILPGLDPYLIETSVRRLERLGVRLFTSTFIDAVEERQIRFKSAETIPYDFMIFTGGIRAVDLIEGIDAPKNRIGQLIVDERLRLPGYEEVYAIGDCTQLLDPAGRPLPPTAQMAEKAAAYVARTIIGKEQAPFDAKMDGLFIALGGRYAAGVLYERIKVKGYFAYLMKKAITRSYRLGLELKVNAGYRNRAKHVRERPASPF